MEYVHMRRSEQQPHNPRLHHALTYATLRAAEMDMGMDRYSLIFNPFEEKNDKNAYENLAQNPPGHPL